jgi:hypothetical protein
MRQLDGEVGDDPLLRGVAALDAHENETEGVAHARQVLFAGIREVTETLTSDFELNDVLQIALVEYIRLQSDVPAAWRD